MKNFARFAALLIVPVGFILGAFLVFINRQGLFSGMPAAVSYVPYIIFTASAAISWWFNKSRVFFCVLSIAFSQVILTAKLPAGLDGEVYLNQAYLFVSFFIPLNILVLSFFKERGVLTLWGIARFAFLFIQAFFFIWWVGGEEFGISRFLEFRIIPLEVPGFNGLPQIVLLVIVLAFANSIFRGVVYKSHVDAAFAAVVPMVAVMKVLKSDEMAVTVFMGFSGLSLFVSVLQDSYFMAFMDELTGLPSRRALKHELMKLSGRYTIAMLDVDFFKKFNDKYGHDVGDEVLKMVASVMRGVTGGGKAFRYGGEEFTVLFPGKGLNEVVPHLETLRENIAGRGFIQRSKNRARKKPKKVGSRSSGGKKLFVTVSIGVAEKNEKHRQSEEVIKAADTALYRAKKKGRNCVSR